MKNRLVELEQALLQGKQRTQAKLAEAKENYASELALRLPNGYQYGGVGQATPTFQPPTRNEVKTKMINNGRRVLVHQGVEYFHCIYCQLDPRLQGLNIHRQYHPESLCQIDHIVPFAVVLQNVHNYYTPADYQQLALRGFVANPGLGQAPASWDMRNLLQRAVLYNDIDNLHIVCTGHNQEKGDQLNYLGQTPAQIRAYYPRP